MPQSATLVNLWRHDGGFNRNPSSLNLSAVDHSPLLVKGIAEHEDLLGVEDQANGNDDAPSDNIKTVLSSQVLKGTKNVKGVRLTS